MSTSLINGLSNFSLQQTLASSLQSAGITPKAGSAIGIIAPAGLSDSSQLSPFARLASTLQQLQQSNPGKYAQVTAQVSANLQIAAQTAQSQGNTTAAAQLTKLANDFSTASQTGQLPNLQDLSQAVSGAGGGHHHHHHHVSSAGSEASDEGTTSAGSTSGTSSQSLSGLLTALQSYSSQSTQTTQNSSGNPGAIIFQTLASAGINAG